MTPHRPAWLQWILVERGAPLWIPALWVAAALVLFGIVQATTERSFYNHTLDLRVALGPLDLLGGNEGDGEAFSQALRQGLESQRGVTLLREETVQNRVASLMGTPLPREPQRWMRATRNLNVSVYVTARLVGSEESLRATVVLWNVGSEAEFARFSSGGKRAAGLGQALADSVSRALFAPPGALHATR